MARAIKQGQHIFIAFQDGEAVLDSQLRPRMYKSREQFEKSFPAWRDGKAELVEYAPTLTPPNEPLTLEELREMKGQPVWTVTTGLDGSGRWELVCDVDYEDVLEMASCVDGFYAIEMDTYGSTWTAYRRPPEGEV